jgi:hypothetical protein
LQVACNMLLETSRRGLQLRFRPHLDRRSTQEVIVPQSCGTPTLGDFGTPIWESRDKKPFGCHSHREVQSILYGQRWWFPPSLGRRESESGPWWVLWIRNCRSWLVLTPKVLQPCANQLVCWFCVGLLEWVNCLSLFLVPSRSSNTPLYPSKVLRVKEHAPSP